MLVLIELVITFSEVSNLGEFVSNLTFIISIIEFQENRRDGLIFSFVHTFQ